MVNMSGLYEGRLMKLTLLLVALLPAFALAQEVRTRVIDVGPGHASITKMPGPHYMVFDAGLVSRSDHIVSQMKELMGADRVIDLLVISHTDSDHLGAVPAIFDGFEVRTVLRSGLVRCDVNQGCRWRTSQNKIREAVAQGKTVDLNLAVSPIGLGYIFNFGEAAVQLVSGFHTPPAEWNVNNASDFRNAGSIVVRLEYDGKSVLFTGDAWGKEYGLDSPMKGAEQFMVDNKAERPIDSDVLIAAHHGADNASSTDFLKEVSPTFVIFPAGGSHQHPRQNTVTRMIRPDVGIAEDKLFRTDQCDSPGPNEWVGAWVPGADDSARDDDIDIVLTKGEPDPLVGYVSSALTCTP